MRLSTISICVTLINLSLTFTLAFPIPLPLPLPLVDNDKRAISNSPVDSDNTTTFIKAINKRTFSASIIPVNSTNAINKRSFRVSVTPIDGTEINAINKKAFSGPTQSEVGTESTFTGTDSISKKAFSGTTIQSQPVNCTPISIQPIHERILHPCPLGLEIRAITTVNQDSTSAVSEIKRAFSAIEDDFTPTSNKGIFKRAISGPLDTPHNEDIESTAENAISERAISQSKDQDNACPGC